MTVRARQIITNLTHHYATNTHPDGWMLDAACRPNPDWTSDIKPKTAILLEMSKVCADCPVIAACAAYALAESVHGGMYAGVWIPHRTSSSWWDARAALHRKTQPLTVTKGVTK